jgi:predicted MFS family arabinose efflux permease
MGFQAASVGAGMMILSAITGWLGKSSYAHSYYVNLAALVSFVLIFYCLPDTGKAVESEGEKVSLNKKVIPVYIFVFLEFFFLITFSTNISMHISGELAGNSSVSGMLTSVYAGSQIIVGLILGQITKVTKRLVLPTAMICFVIGAALLVAFPDNYPMLIIAALFCGFSQGIYCPSGFVEVSNAVPPVAVALASAGFNAAACAGQTISPALTNFMSKAIFGTASTGGVYLISAVGMAVSAIAYSVVKLKSAK